jgi:hypothetical protein
MSTTSPAKVLGPGDGRAGKLGSIGVRFMIRGEESGGGFALVEHPIWTGRLPLMALDASRTLTWPDGTVYRITRSSEETGGAELEMEWQLPAGGWAAQPHVHPGLTEEYELGHSST